MGKTEKGEIPLLEKNDVVSEKKSDEKNLEGNINQGVAIFVIHEHDATRLHWDLRLQIGGVLRSWAVPKEPPVDIGVKRLAIQVEDHPLEYGNFEGVIPEGTYGAGTVKIFDKGEFKLIEENEKGLTFELKGKKMIGKYSLIKFKGDKQWLFFKRR